MSIICICVHSTEENDRLKYTKECLESLIDTVDYKKHKVYVINNASSPETKKYLSTHKNHYTITHLSENIGTARGINMGLFHRIPGEMAIKMDDDVVVHQSAWVEELENTICADPTLGIVGLKRPDVWQNPNHDNPIYRTKMETLANGVEVEVCDDIMGTCTAFNPELMDRIGLLSQPTAYGFDDVIYSVRSIVAGFRNCFLPGIKITHLDDYKNPYSDWKKRHAGEYIEEVADLCKLIKRGVLSYYYDGK